MANDINTVVQVGRLTKDGELKQVGGSSVLKFSIASNWSKKVGDNWEDQVNYFDVQIWGRRAESLEQYLKRGTQVSVSGVLRQDRWEQDGQTRSRVFINADNIQLLGSRDNSNGGNNQQSNNSSNGNQGFYKPSKPAQSSQNFEDDIPF